tara:strand:- start:1061 stop:1906 length:846 start_codon:yes stop_codon:yes gene_type:complete
MDRFEQRPKMNEQIVQDRNKAGYKPKPEVLIACNTLTGIHGEIYHNHARLFYCLGRDYPKFDFKQFFARRLSIDRFRNMAAKLAIQQGCKYLMFIDDDMKLPHDSFGKLEAAMRQGYGIVSAFTYIRGYPFEIMSFKYEDPKAKPRRLINLTNEDLPSPLGPVVPVEAIGTAVCIISVDVLRKTPGPWFVTGPHHTEDIYFCIKAKEYNPKLKIGMHTGISTGHLLDPECITDGTRDALLKYHEAFMDPFQVEMAKNKDRGQAYVEQNVEPASVADATGSV